MELPKGWIETKLGVIAEWGSGGTPDRSESNYFNGTIPWIKTGDLNDSIIFEASEYITKLGLKNSSAKLFPKGSIIVAMYGATIGKTAKLGIDATTNQACAVAQASKIILPEFLHYFLKSEKQEFIEKGKGGAQPNISQTVIKEHPFPLPPLPEQQRIVAKLDALFEKLDKIKTHLERIPQLLKDFRQSVLNQAVTGKLTENWREGRKMENWETKNLKQLGEVTGGLTLNSVRNQLPIQMPYLRVANVYSNRLELSEIKKIGVAEREIERTILQKKDLLIVEGNGSRDQIGRVSQWNNEIENCLHQNHLIKFRPIKSINSTFVLYFILSDFGRQQIKEISKSSSGLYTLSLSKVSMLEIEIPDLIEQNEIVRRVESLFSISDKIEQQYQTLKVKIDQLPLAILAKAFKGELVEQHPIDGDARVLLEEIQRAKTEQEKTNRTKTKRGKTRKLQSGKDVRMVAEPEGRYEK